MITRLPSDAVLQGRYKIIRLLGAGGMGAVYLAEQLGLGRKVAVKENFSAEPTAREQFRLEAQILAGLRHPNLPMVIEHFEANERQYLVMEYVEGEDLDELVHRSGLQRQSQVIDWMDQVLNAVQYLHNQKPYPIVHRDIKPSNIKLHPDGKVVLVDFGIAKVLHTSRRTVTGARAVTEGFSPPEQYGSGTDTRSDIYSLGATVYFLLSGQVPPPAVERLIGRAQLASLQQLNHSVSRNTERVVWRMLELEANRRYQRIEDVRRAFVPESERELSFPEPTMPPPTLSRRLPPLLPKLQQIFSRRLPPPPPPVPPTPIFIPGEFPRGPLRTPSKDLRIPLKQALSEVKNSIFTETRGYLANEILKTILNVDPEEEGTTILLRSYKGGGTSEILKRVLKGTHKQGGKNHVVVRIDLSADSYQRAHLQFLRDLVKDIGMQLTANASFEVHRAIKLIYDKYKRTYEQFKSKGRKVVTRTRIAPLTIFELVSSSLRTAFGLGIGKEVETTDELIPSDPPDTEELIEDMISDLCELAGYVSKERGRLVLMLNKVEHLEILDRLERLAKRSGTVIITVVDKQHYDQWIRQNPKLVLRFAQRQWYINCLWALPGDLCEKLFRDVREIDSDEFRIFLHYLKYYGRGRPDRIMKVLTDPSQMKEFSSLKFSRAGFQTIHGVFEVPLSKLKEWYKYARLETVLQTAGWVRMFPDEDDPRCCRLDSFDEEQRDQIKQGIYALLDWLIKQSQEGSTPTINEVYEYARTNCGMPFTAESTQRVVQEQINLLREFNMLNPSQDKLDLSRLTRTG